MESVHEKIEIIATNIRQRFTCEDCGLKVTNEKALEKHKKSVHDTKKIEKITSSKNTSKRIHCKVCDKKFNKMETFDRHIEKEHGPQKQKSK